MVWKGIKIKFNNLELNVATDGDKIRIRKAGVVPIVEELTEDMSKTVKIMEDIVFAKQDD